VTVTRCCAASTGCGGWKWSIERQEYALGTVCAAIPITIGSTAATLAISLPSSQADRLLIAARQLQTEVGRLLGSLAISISI
jgi:DNA-binding IclR family transcriptional regulator